MCALLLKPHAEKGEEPKRGILATVTWPVKRFFGGFNYYFDKMSHAYGRFTARAVRMVVIMLCVYGGVLALGGFEFRRTPVGFIPQVDQGYLIVASQLPSGASISRTDEVMRRAADIVLNIPGVEHVVNVVGFSGATFTNAPNAGAMFTVLAPYNERAKHAGQSAPAIQQEIIKRLSSIQEAFLIAVMPPPVRGIGTAGGFRMMIEDRAGQGSAALLQATYAMMGRAAQTPGLTQVFSLFENSTPQLYLDIDRAKAQLLGVNVTDVFSALQIYIGSAYVNDFNLLGKTFRVMVQADSPYRMGPEDVLRIRVRNNAGDTVPLGSFTTVQDISGPYRVPRYNLYAATELDGNAAPGYSQGQAIQIMEKLAKETLPEGFAFEWTTLAFQQIRAGNTAAFAFILAVVFVFLVLAAQYESLTLPIAVIMIVPMCLVAAIIGVSLRGQDNNILTQVGFVVLIALAAKNAILIVEFAKQLEDEGRDRWAAAVEAAHLRLRPILMTSLAFILGVFPLVVAIGAGAELRQALGTAVFSGMIGVTFFGLIFTPVFYIVCRWIAAHAERFWASKRPEVIDGKRRR
jgi:hydrophobe/amphiphile efflux-1 (HAE1) family protein